MKITNVNVYGMNESIIASGFPMRADFGEDCDAEFDGKAVLLNLQPDENRDIERAVKLSSFASGEGHHTFLCGIAVQMNVTAPRYWWPEFQRYHFAEIVSSSSTMHRLKNFMEKYIRLLDMGQNDELKQHIDRHFSPLTSRRAIHEFVIGNEKVDDIEILKADLPEGYLQTARITTNYRQLKTIYAQRYNHRLDEWKKFCAWIVTLPRAQELILGGLKLNKE